MKKTLLFALVLTGCASLQNTPQQDLIWNAYSLCKAEVRNNVQILRVDPNEETLPAPESTASPDD